MNDKIIQLDLFNQLFSNIVNSGIFVSYSQKDEEEEDFVKYTIHVLIGGKFIDYESPLLKSMQKLAKLVQISVSDDKKLMISAEFLVDRKSVNLNIPQ